MHGWKAVMVGTVFSMCSLALAQVTTSGGTTNVIPKFTGGSQIGDSHISDSNGNIGIGTLNPAATLDVQGTRSNSIGVNTGITKVGGDDVYLYTGALNGSPSYAVWIQTMRPSDGLSFPLALNPNGGNVGIGTAAPGSALEIDGNRSAMITQSQTAAMPDGLTYDVGGIIYNDRFLRDTNPSAPAAYLKIRNVNTLGAFPTTIRGTQIELGTANGLHGQGTTATTALAISPDGNVGIGTTSPGARLELNGSLKLTTGSGASMAYPDGTIQATAWNGTTCGGDYAESVDVAGDRRSYEPGDVLVLAASGTEDVEKSQEPYSSLVAGIYSTKPGLTGRRQSNDPKAGPGEVPMAMVGIVPTKVSAENGAIKRGDLLVTSSKVGYAMKGTDRGRMLGAVVGKAMGSLEQGTGVIEVLVTLQ
ncbi:hypothetical protein [Terriglobus tenax]|uniref:hypothetical protein n=1 Tax=Terriglobus tenax TaxID=1111115 RepID=UPI0021DF535A|nr:hypothetical protein [Terriglobus tenax]